MPKRITYLQKKHGLSRDAFRAHWSGPHGEIARDLPGVTAYRQNHVVDLLLRPVDSPEYRVDGIVELWFADDGVVRAGYESDVADRLVVDEPNFLSGLTGGPVTSGLPYGPWPAKVWLLGRWGAGARDAGKLERWAAETAAVLGALGASVNVLVEGSQLLVREALRTEDAIPEIALGFGFGDEAAAAASVPLLVDRLTDLEGYVERIQGLLVEEVVIV